MGLSAKEADRHKRVIGSYRKMRKDRRLLPQFIILASTSDASKGEIHVYRKEEGEEPVVSRGTFACGSLTELASILEVIGQAWKDSNP